MRNVLREWQAALKYRELPGLRTARLGPTATSPEDAKRPRSRGPGPDAENGGFEPPRALTQHAFQACAIGR